jgi:hypothetical protein
LVRDAARLLAEAGLGGPVVAGEIELVQSRAGGGYARPTPEAERAVILAREAGIRAETTYTGKALAHLFSGGFRGRRVLFWNTFGG